MQDPSAPRVRPWAARAALLLACLGSIATSGTPIGPEESSQMPDVLWTLSRQSPTAVRHFRLAVSEDKPTTRRLAVRVSESFIARWTPDSPNRAANPAIRARLSAPSEFGSDSQWSPSFSFQENAEGTVMFSQTDVTASASSLPCDTHSTCAWSFTLEVELQTDDPGTLSVEGTQFIHVSVLDTDKPMQGYHLTLSEE